jgi:hypothetical protein
MKGDYTYKLKGKPQAENVDAVVSISNSSSEEAGTDEDPEVPPLQAEECQLISLIYLRCEAPLLKEWSGEGGTVSKIVRTLGYTVNKCRRVKEVIANYHHMVLMGMEPLDHNRKRRPTTTQQLPDEARSSSLYVFVKSGMMINWWCIKNDIFTVT